MPSKAAANALKELQQKFPELRAGIDSCRKISGTTQWSQHADGNALDIHHVNWGYSADPTHQKWLDGVAAFIRVYRLQLSVNNLLWRVQNHYDHCHIDFWPKMYGTPRCAGGRDDWQYSSGRIVLGDPGPENGYIDIPPSVTIPNPPPPPARGYFLQILRNTIKEGSRGDLVAIAQSLLARHGYAPPNTFNAQHRPDGIFGGGTTASVKSFQRSKGLTVDGIIAEKTWATLESV